MKILQVIDLFSPLHGGGSVEVAYHLSKELTKRGHEVAIYTSDFELDQEYIDSLHGVKVYPFHTWSNTIGLTPGIVNKTRREIKYFDIIHLHNYRSFQQIVIHHYARKYNIPYVLQVHGSVATYFEKGILKRIFDRLWGYRILKDASKVFAVTKTEAEQYKSMSVSEDKIEIIPNGIDLSEYNNLPKRGEFRRKNSLNDSQKVILYLGRLNKIKGLDLLAKAFARFSRDFANARLVVVGPDDGYLLTLKRLIEELKIKDKVVFTGPLYQRDKLEAYVDADVYVLPSAYEIFGITVLEAYACGTPVIVTDRCGIAEWIGSNVGYVVQYDQEQLQEAIFKILANEKLREQLKQEGKKLIGEHFAWSKIVEQVEDLYERILK